MVDGPLHGIKVFDVTQVLAGPFCSLILADLGAEVVKVEPPAGDSTRASGQVMPGESKTFHAINRGKRSIVIDLGNSEGRKLAQRMIRNFDVFVINTRPGVAERLGLDYETLRNIRPDLIYLENTGFGNTGPNATQPGSDLVVQAYSGIMAGEGHVDEDGAPVRLKAFAPTDFMAGAAGAIGICAALHHRDRTGVGQKVSTSLLAAGLTLQSFAVSRMPVFDALVTDPMLVRLGEAEANGASYVEQLEILGNPLRAVTGAFRLYYQGYRVKDGAIILGALTAANRDQIRSVLGMLESDPTRNPDFNAVDPASELVVEEVRDHIREVLLTKTVDEWLELFEKEGAPASRVNFAERMADDPQVEAMGYLLDIEHELTGPERMVGPFVSMSATPTGARRPSPPLGHDTDAVLREHGVTEDEIQRLRELGAIY